MKRKKAKNSEIGSRKRVSVNHRKRKMLTNIAFLPDDLLFSIFVLLSAEDIHDNVRLVCKKWYDLINTRHFKFAHFDHTPPGLLIQDQCNPQRAFFVGMEQGQIEVSNFNLDFGNRIWGSCHGLILEYKLIDNNFVLFISNPVKKHKLALPAFCLEGLCICSYGLAYSVASMVYKVVMTYAMWDEDSYSAQCAILTVGVDNTWRHVDIQHLSRRAKKQLVRKATFRFGVPVVADSFPLVPFVVPIIAEGFMHWSTDYSYFATINVESETFREILSPLVHGDPTDLYCFSSGRNLSLLIANDKLCWEVWEMEPQAGEWTYLWLVDLDDKQCILQQFDYKRKTKRHRHLRPVGWLKYKEVLVLGSFDAFRTFIAYDISKDEISSFQLTSGRRLRYSNNVHKKSLIWLDG